MEEILLCVKNGDLRIDEAKSLLLDITNSKESSVNAVLKMISKDIISVKKAMTMLGAIKSSSNKIHDNLDESNESNENNENKEKKKIKRRTPRPLEYDEFVQILKLCNEGFQYEDNGKSRKFRPNKRLLMTFTLQANLGLRISDILTLKPSIFKNNKLEIIEKKTGKLQNRTIHPNLKNLIYEYAFENGINQNDYIIPLKRAGIHKQLKIITNYLGLTNISSHSFRKMFATKVYDQTKDIELVKELLNHSDVSTTQKYLRVTQQKINDVSASIDFTSVLNVESK